MELRGNFTPPAMGHRHAPIGMPKGDLMRTFGDLEAAYQSPPDGRRILG